MPEAPILLPVSENKSRFATALPEPFSTHSVPGTLHSRGAFPMTMAELPKSPSITTLDDVQRDLGALRNDVTRLSKELSNYISDSSRKALRTANDQLEDAIRERPFAAVATAAGFGLLCAAIFWRR
jgi:hypothetical protein